MPDGDVLTLDSGAPGGSGSIDGEDKFTWIAPAPPPSIYPLAADSVDTVQLVNLAVTDAKVSAANKDGAAATPSMRTLGAGALQATAGNDTRLSDARAPTGAAGGDLLGSTYPNPVIAPLAVTDGKVATANKDGTAGTPSMRTLGTGALQAAAGNDARIPGTLTYSLVDIALTGFAATSNVAGNQTTGVMYYTTKAISVTGVRFFWKRNASNKTIRVAIWSVTTATTGVSLASVDVAVTVNNAYTGVFGAPVAIAANTRFMITMWETGGTEYTGGQHGVAATFDTCILGLVQAPCALCGPNLVLLSSRVGGANAFPNAAANALSDVYYPVEPVIA